MRALLDFVRAHPAPGAPVDKADWFLGSLCRGAEAVIDLAIDGRRMLVGVVIDTCANAGDLAEFVVLGFDAERAEEALLREALERAVGIASEGPRRALEVFSHGVFPAALLEAAAFAPDYGLHEMEREGGALEPALPPADFAWRDADEGLGSALHRVVAEAFADVPGSFVPPRGVFVERLGTQPIATRVLVHGGRVAAFVRPEPQGAVGTIGALGVAGWARGRGLGRLALREGMRVLADLGARRFRLDVAARNQHALRLYTAEGFATVRTLTAWVRPLRRA